MHELGVVMQACDEISAFAVENNIPKISEVVLEIGEGSGIVEGYVHKVWPVAIKDNPVLDGANLIIEMIPGIAMCLDCKEIYNVLENKGACPSCGSRMKEILSGTDFSIKEVHVPEDN